MLCYKNYVTRMHVPLPFSHLHARRGDVNFQFQLLEILSWHFIKFWFPQTVAYSQTRIEPWLSQQIMQLLTLVVFLLFKCKCQRWAGISIGEWKLNCSHVFIGATQNSPTCEWHRISTAEAQEKSSYAGNITTQSFMITYNAVRSFFSIQITVIYS